MRITSIPAALAARTPASESSSTRHSAGCDAEALGSEQEKIGSRFGPLHVVAECEDDES